MRGCAGDKLCGAAAVSVGCRAVSGCSPSLPYPARSRRRAQRAKASTDVGDGGLVARVHMLPEPRRTRLRVLLGELGRADVDASVLLRAPQ